MSKGVTPLYYRFIQRIQSDPGKFAFLQLVGRLEDYLVKELVYHIHVDSQGSRFAITNIGNKSEQKFDIAVLRGDLEKPTITALIEAKYIRNRHRAWHFNAADETIPSLKSLATQLMRFNLGKQSHYSVNLSSPSKEVYGLVFASYVSLPTDEKEEKKRFFDGQLEKARTLEFRYHDLPKPYFKKIYDDVCVKILGHARYCSLRVGLWKLKQ